MSQASATAEPGNFQQISETLLDYGDPSTFIRDQEFITFGNSIKILHFHLKSLLVNNLIDWTIKVDPPQVLMEMDSLLL